MTSPDPFRGVVRTADGPTVITRWRGGFITHEPPCQEFTETGTCVHVEQVVAGHDGPVAAWIRKAKRLGWDQPTTDTSVLAEIERDLDALSSAVARMRRHYSAEADQAARDEAEAVDPSRRGERVAGVVAKYGGVA